jgi:acetylornithine deacetylase/succinyl-diaminopimelate desuccinylase-like protein
MTAAATQKVLATIDRDFDASLARLFEFLRFPSVGTDPAHHGDCLRTAEWLKDLFDGMGFAARIHPTTGRPVVVARYEPPEAAMAGTSHVPHVLFYGHYDVQPADPLDLWTTPPFSPRVGKGRDGRDCIFARGASDDKGQVMTFVEASRAWLAENGSLPFRLTLLIEGDEEGDSVHLDRFVAANKELLKADIALVCDTGLWDPKTPAIVTSLRGCIGEDVTISGPRIDLHSGYFGGPAVNPIKVLSRIMGGLHDKTGRVTIPGFYDGVASPTAAQRKAWKALNFDTKEMLGGVGLKTPAGEASFSALEQIWVRPTVEVNGILGGYTGAGSKTVLPAEATAKLTFRLVAGQKPSSIAKAFRAFVKTRLPPDCKARFVSHGGGAAVSVPHDSGWINMAKKALGEEWGRTPVLAGEGGSIPVVESFAQHLKLDSIMMGFCNDDDALHSPDENYKVESYHKGTRAWARFIGEIINQTEYGDRET